MILSITFFFTAVIGKLGYIQFINGSVLQARAAEQWMRDLPVTPIRGKIIDANGIVLADSSTLYDIYVRPNSVKNADNVARLLADVLGIQYEKLYEKITSARVSEITIAKNVTRDKTVEIVTSELSGIYVSENILRYYNYGNFLTQLLGYVDYDKHGQEGLEKYFDKYLYGVNGYSLTETDLVGRDINAPTSYIPAINGQNVNLTIDYYIQSLAESAVNDAMLRHKAQSASCIVMNVNTGAVLAMANAPNFDLNDIPRNDIATLYTGSKNHIVGDVIEPGSTFKILTAAAAIEEGIVTDASAYYCGGNRIVDGQKIKCWKTAGHGSQNFATAVKNSCNCCFMDCALGLGTDTFYGYLDKFGLFRKTGIELYGESMGISIKAENVKNVDLARIGFGQAIAVTPLQLVTAAAAAVNGGKLMQPYIVSSIYDETSGKITYNNSPRINHTVVSEATSKKLREYLEGVVSDGSGKNAYVNGYRIGGKTGTAQKYVNGAIARGKYVSSFLGFAPADKPEYIMLMIVDEPDTGVYYGSIVAAPYANYVFSNLFAHFNVAPANFDASYDVEFEMPDLYGDGQSEVFAKFKALNLAYECEGEGKAVYQIPAAGSLINKYTTVYVRFQ